MPKTKTFRVINSRFHFRCAECGAKRMISIPPAVRRRSYRCHKCKELTRCIMNRRIYNREQQLGVAIMTNFEGYECDVHLADISLYGVGFDIKLNDLRKIGIGKTVTLRCPWNPKLLNSRRYVVKSIKGQRVGAQIEQKRF